MRIPKTDVVRFLLAQILKERKVISQKELASTLARELAKAGDYSISGARARMIAVETPGVTVKTHTKKGPVPERCPSCGASLRKTYSRNLKGRKTLVRLTCRRCGYTGTNQRFAPHRYEFELSFGSAGNRA